MAPTDIGRPKPGHAQQRDRYEAPIRSFALDYVILSFIRAEMNREVTLYADLIDKTFPAPYLVPLPDGQLSYVTNARLAAALHCYWAACAPIVHGELQTRDALLAMSALWISDRAVYGDHGNDQVELWTGVRRLEELEVPAREITRAIVIARLMLDEVAPDLLDPRVKNKIEGAKETLGLARVFASSRRVGLTDGRFPSEDALTARFGMFHSKGTDEARLVKLLTKQSHRSIVQQRSRRAPR